jgi:electron transfer flavoprotein alpha subunit
MSNILVVYEIRDQKIKKVSFEATSAAIDLSKQIGGSTYALLIGAGISNFAKEAEKYGVSKVFVVDNSNLTKYSHDVYAKIIADVTTETGIKYIFMGATATGKDILPRVAYLLNSSIVQDITGIEVKDGKVIYNRPILAGKLISQVIVNSKYQLATLRPNVFVANENPSSAEVVQLSPEIQPARLVVEEIVSEAGSKLDVTEADIIVSGGRGMQSPGNWSIIEKLANVLGAATGASRAVVDAGWRDHGEQVGQTGKTVSPNLYIACGISGAIQHQAGMTSSKHIVAINKDEEAPIFKIADYGIVGDAVEILPKLTEEIQKVITE